MHPRLAAPQRGVAIVPRTLRVRRLSLAAEAVRDGWSQGNLCVTRSVTGTLGHWLP
jgi:hypothetical protein